MGILSEPYPAQVLYLSDGLSVDADLIEHAAMQESRTVGSALGVQTAGWSSPKMGTVGPLRHAQRQLSPYLPGLVPRDILSRVVTSYRKLEMQWWYTRLPVGGEVLEHDHKQAEWVVSYVLKGHLEIELELESRLVLMQTGALISFGPKDRHRVRPVSHELLVLTLNFI